MQTIPTLNLNSNPNTFKDGDAKEARNMVVTKDLKAVRNENGFTSLITTQGKIHGKIELPNGFILFTTVPDTIIYVLNDTIVKTISSSYFNFDSNYPIKGDYTFNSDGDLIVTFSEGINGNNETRIINITKSPTTLSKINVDKLDIIPNIKYPKIYATQVEGGSLRAGTYQLSISYKVDNSIYSNYSILSVPIHVTSYNNEHVKIGDIVNSRIIINFSNLDTRYDKFKIGILYKGEDSFESCWETDDIVTSISTYTLYNTDSYKSISIDDLTIPSVSYIRDEASTVFTGRMYRANVKTINYTGLDTVMQNIANNVTVKLEPNPNFETPGIDILGITTKHFKEGEYYVLYIGCLDYKGNFVNAYPIPCKDGDDTLPVNASESNTFKIHEIPYLSMGEKVLQTLKCTLPTNINELLGTFNNIITSFCYLYAKHDFYNSKVLAQGFAITDFVTNDFSEQTYFGPFNSRSKLRFYSLEHLFLKSKISNASISKYKLLPIYGLPAMFLTGKGIYGTHLMNSSNAIPIESSNYIRNNNSVDSNIAGESHIRLNIPEAKGIEVFGDSPIQPNDLYIRDPSGLIGDITSNNTSFYDDLYHQKLVMASSIISKNDTSDIVLVGDFFFNNFTFRITGPHHSYRYGTEDPELQSIDHVYRYVVSINLESRFNLKARYEGTNMYQKVYNIISNDDAKAEEFYNIPYDSDNFINTDTGKGYDLNAHYLGYDYNVYEKEIDVKSHFGNRVIRSVIDSTESRGIPWRIFKSDDYKDLPLNRGSLTNIESDERSIYLQQEYSLSVAGVRDKLSNSDEGEAYLGSSDVFDREPYEVLFEKTGYIGCNSRFASIMTAFGYLVIDVSKQNIFLVKGVTSKKLNNENVEEFFDNVLKDTSTNPYKDNGLALLYDDEIKSLFVTKLGLKPFTIHFNFPINGWISFHDYLPNSYIATRTSSYCIKQNTVYKRHANNKGVYFSSDSVKSNVTFIYNVEPEAYKQILALMFATRITDGNKLYYDKTFDTVMFYNDTQCTGVLDVNKAIDWFDKDSGTFVRDGWFVNKINDIVVNDKEPFMNEDGSLISSNLNLNLDWFTKSYFISKYCFIKFVYNNDKVDNKYLDMIFNAYEVNAVKSLR